MSKLGSAIYELHTMDSLAKRDQWLNRIHPLVKLVLTVVYILCVVSFDKYEIPHLMLMGIYLIVLFQLGELSFVKCVKRLRYVLPLLCVMGIFNPIFDREEAFFLGSFCVTGGMISMVTLLIKGCYSIFASYLLVATTSIEKLCYALERIHIPEIFVTQIMLTYRYISVLLEESHRITQAYSMRAPKQKGIHIQAWGSLVGQLLLRSMDRATTVYESMMLRGYTGKYSYVRVEKIRTRDWLFLGVWLILFMIIRL